MTRSRAASGRMFLIFALILAGFAGVGMKMYEVQIERHEELFRKAKKRYTAQKTERMMRGKIYDYEGNLLVGNRHVMTLAFDPSLVTDPEERKTLAHFLARNLPEIPFREFLRKLNSGDRTKIHPVTGKRELDYSRYVVIARNIEYSVAENLQKKAAGLRLSKGLIFEKTSCRTYPKNEMLANILGYNSSDGNEQIPVSGLEKTFREQMRPEDKTIRYEHERSGRAFEMEEARDGRNGYNLYLTIREPLQAILEEELDRMYNELNPKAIYAVMADPYTGDILAMSQRPTFNPNDRRTMSGESSRIRTATDMFEPGSVMKPFTIAMALDKGFITPSTKIDTGFGPWFYAGKLIHDTHYIGTATPIQIIQNSSNIGTAMIAVSMGAENLHSSLRSFHFGEKTNLPLRPEEHGRLYPVKRWSKLSVSRVCIGHEVMVTPLQLVRAYCMLANGGYSVDLRLIDSIENDDGKKKQPYRRSSKPVFQNKNTSREILRMLKTVTLPGGTAEAAAVPGFHVAGKTGTANKTEHGVYTKKYFATFCGFVPAERPRFVLLVTCDEPQGSKQYGGSVSGPVFSKIAERALRYLCVRPEMTLEAWEQERKECRRQHYADLQRREAERLGRRRRSTRLTSAR